MNADLALLERGGRPRVFTVCPYFSVWVGGEEPACYCLGQAPVRDKTTLRRVTQGAHYHLGEGPKPGLTELLEVLPSAHLLEVRGASTTNRDALDGTDQRLSAGLVKSSLPEAIRLAREDEENGPGA